MESNVIKIFPYTFHNLEKGKKATKKGEFF